jgi:hypothetical protein
MIPLILLFGLASVGAGYYTRPLSDQVTLALTAEQNTYYVRESIHLKLTLKNVQSKPVRGFFMISPLSPKAEMRYRRVGSSSFVTFPYLGRKGGYVDSPGTLAPDKELAGEDTLAFDSVRQAFVLDEPGDYEFHVVYRDAPEEPNALLESNVLTVHVQPVPENEREASASYSKDLALLAQFDPRWSYASPELTKRAMEFLDRFPNSPFASHLRQGLEGALHYKVGRNRATKEERALYEKLQAERVPNQ